MPEQSARASDSHLDEQRLGRAVAIGLPLATLAGAAVVGMTVGPATSILVLAAGVLLGVIALLWTSVRILSGDAELSPELEALDLAAHGVDALASRKKMLLRALKDLENEHAIGKMDDDDFEQLASTYRAELKTVLQRIDDALAPHRARAEEAARAHLEKVGLGTRGEAAEASTERAEAEADAPTPQRLTCPKCEASNEPDAKFCKECATKLAAEVPTDA